MGGLERIFAVSVCDFRDKDDQSDKTKALVDFMWGVWCGQFDEEITELCRQEMQSCAPQSFLWHRYLQESSKEIGTRYRAFVEACQGGPISAEAAGSSIAGASELTDDAKEEAQELRRLLLKLRRNTVSFATLRAVGGASGADHSRAQLEKLWNDMRLGHKYARKN